MSASYTAAAPFTASLSGPTGPNDLTLIDSVGGQYALAFTAAATDPCGNVTGTWALSRIAGAQQPFEYPVINYTAPGYYGSPSSTRLTIAKP